MPANSKAKRICIALDGTLSEPRSGRQEIGTPVAGALEWLAQAHAAGFHLIISNARPPSTVWAWLKLHAPGLEQIVHVSASRPDAEVYIDSRAIPFDGTWPTTTELEAFTPWWQQQSD